MSRNFLPLNTGKIEDIITSHCHKCWFLGRGYIMLLGHCLGFTKTVHNHGVTYLNWSFVPDPYPLQYQNYIPLMYIHLLLTLAHLIYCWKLHGHLWHLKTQLLGRPGAAQRHNTSRTVASQLQWPRARARYWNSYPNFIICLCPSSNLLQWALSP